MRPGRSQRASEYTSDASAEHGGQQSASPPTGDRPPARCRTAPASRRAGRRRSLRARCTASASLGQIQQRKPPPRRFANVAISAMTVRVVRRASANEQHQRAGQQRDDDRQDDKMLQQLRAFMRPAPRHRRDRCPSSRAEASSTTRNSAVVAKPITIAVSTSACGTGSRNSDGSIVLDA